MVFSIMRVYILFLFAFVFLGCTKNDKPPPPSDEISLAPQSPDPEQDLAEVQNDSVENLPHIEYGIGFSINGINGSEFNFQMNYQEFKDLHDHISSTTLLVYNFFQIHMENP